MDRMLNTETLNRMCRGRGLTFDRTNPTEDLLIPPSGSTTDLDEYRSLLDHYAVRLLLKEVIKSGNRDAWLRGRKALERFCHAEALDSFLDRLSNIGIIRGHHDGYPVPSRRVTSFGATYEWYVAQVLSSDFLSPAAWGVRFSEMESGGDHDVISSVSGHFLYLEAKTSPPKHIEQAEISGFIRRLNDIAPDIAVFNNDTHLRMKDKIVPMMEEAIEQIRVHPSTGSGRGRPESRGKESGALMHRCTDALEPHFQRLEREVFHLGSCIYIINSKPDVKRNLRVVLRHYFGSRSRVVKELMGDW